MALNIKIILLVLLGGAIALFLIQNVAEVEIQFLLWSMTMRRSTLVLLVLGIGVIVGWVLHGFYTRSQRRRKEADLQRKPQPDRVSASAESSLIDRDR